MKKRNWLSSLRVTAATILTVAPMLIASEKSATALSFQYSTCMQIQNLSSGVANVNVTFYDQNGSETIVDPFDIAGAGDKTFCPLVMLASPYIGSAVVSSNQEVGVVMNVQGKAQGDDQFANAAYIGQASGSMTVSLPLLFKNYYGFNTFFSVQNAGTTDTNVTVTYSDGTTSSKIGLKPNTSVVFDQSLENHNAALFAAEVSSNAQPVVVTLIQESSKSMFAVNGFTEGSLLPVMPLINANYYGYETGVQIGNSGNTATQVTVTYTKASDGSSCTETQTIQPKSSATFALGVFTYGKDASTTSNCVEDQEFVGSARVTTNSASQPLTIVVNQQNVTDGTGEAYAGFDPSKLTSAVKMPLIMDRNYGWFTGFNVMNASDVAATVTCTFSGTSYKIENHVLAAGQALNRIQNGAIAPGYVGSGTCSTNTPGAKLAGVVNELMIATGDKFFVYEGINVASVATQ